MKTKDAITAIKEILPSELHRLADPLADLIIWAYDKGREDERKEPICEWLSGRDIWELKDAKIFIDEELERQSEAVMDARFDWERTAEND